MKRSYLVVAFLLVLCTGTALLAQPRAIGGRNVILDDNAGNEAYITTSLGGVGINMININPNACAILDLNSQVKGFLPPRMVPLEIAALCGGTPPEGLIVYNTHTHTLDIWNGSSWTGQWQTRGNTNLTLDNIDNLLGSTAISTVKPFNLVVGGNRIVRYEVNNRIQGGHPSNTVHSIAHGAIIAGGGQLGNPNMITQQGLYSVVGGGRGNVAGGDAGAGDAFVGGGIGNNAAGARTVIGGGYFNTANVNASTIGGGANNTTGIAAPYATIAGGNGNTATGGNAFIGGGQANAASGGGATIAGGWTNQATNFDAFVGAGAFNLASGYRSGVMSGELNEASGDRSVVLGGYNNTASGIGSAVVGGGWDGAFIGSNTASGNGSFVGGGRGNTASGAASVIAGGSDNTVSSGNSTIGGGGGNNVSGGLSTIAGGNLNIASGGNSSIVGGLQNTASGVGAFIGGGSFHQATNGNSTIAGGTSNTATGANAFIGAGQNNTAGGQNATIGGGFTNLTNGGSNRATIAGGAQNQINSTGTQNTIGGGGNNHIDNSAANSVIAGGINNLIGLAPSHAVISGGTNNQATGTGATVGGGSNNNAAHMNVVLAGGSSNLSSGDHAVVSGGSSNMAGAFSAVAGGQNLIIGSNSFGFNSGTAANVSAASSIGYFGNVNVWIGNTDASARQLRLYENNATNNLSADFASFQAPAVMNATTQYALPINFGTSGIAPYFLADVTGAGTPRQLTWVSGNSSNWLLTGNSGSNPATNFIGTTDAADFVIRTGVGAIERMRFLGAPAVGSSATPLMTINNPTLNQQGLRINGTADAIPGLGGSTLAANPGVWDLVVVGDAVVTNVLKMGSSIWFDGINNPHNIKANQRFQIGTTSSNDLTFMTNNTERMYVDSTGRIGIGTKDPVSPLHIQATPPQAIPPDTNALGFVTPEPRHHVLTVENMYTPSAYNLYNRGNGIAVVIHTPHGTDITNDGLWNNSRTNYMTFYNDDGTKDDIRGRIEGFSYEDYLRMAAGLDVIMDGGELFNPFNWFSFNVDFFDFDPGFISFDENFLTFDGDFIHFTPPSFPTLSGGSFPTLCCFGIDWSGFSIDWPDISGGSWPSLSGGSIGSLSFDPPVVLNGSPVIINGSPLINFENPFTLNQAYIDLKAAQIAALPYKEKAADAVMNPVGAAVKFGASFKAGVTYESGSGDYAEWLERADPNEVINFGDVVGVKGGKISKNTSGTNQYMVATWKPIVLGNMPEPGREKDYTKVAFLGQIPVKIVGGCRKGDYILPSGRNDGFAFALAPSRLDAADLDKVLGIAWDDAYETSPRYVKIAVGLKPHEMVTIIQKQQAQIENLQERVNEIDLLKQEMAEIKEAVAASSKVVSAKKSTKKPKFRYKTTTSK